MSESGDGVRKETKLELRRRLLREVFADFEAQGVGLRLTDNLSREELYRCGRRRAEAAETETACGSNPHFGRDGGGERECL